MHDLHAHKATHMHDPLQHSHALTGLHPLSFFQSNTYLLTHPFSWEFAKQLATVLIKECKPKFNGLGKEIERGITRYKEFGFLTVALRGLPVQSFSY